MSADNWKDCPECSKKVRDHRTHMEASYGKVSLAEWKALEKQAMRLAEHHDTTLREDYEQGMDDDGLYRVSYCGECQDCKFRFIFAITINPLNGTVVYEKGQPREYELKN